MNVLQGPANALGVELQQVTVGNANDLEGAFDAAVRQRADAAIVYGGELFITERAHVGNLALARRLPTLYARRESVEAGGLMAYAPNVADLWHRAADYLDKILKGTKPADLPVQLPTSFDFVVNVKTAQALGLTIPHVDTSAGHGVDPVGNDLLEAYADATVVNSPGRDAPEMVKHLTG